MWSSVDEVRHSDERGGDAYDGAVEGGDEDFAVRVEGLGYVEIVGGEGLEPLLVLLVFRAGITASYRDVGAAGEVSVGVGGLEGQGGRLTR